MTRQNSLTPRQIERVRETFAIVARTPRETAATFYARLFELDPSTRAMFPADLEPQGRKLLGVLALAVDRLDDLEALGAEVEALGRRHVAYGVEARHYMAVREALLWTLEDALGADFCQDARTGWRTAYVLLSARMMMGAARVVLAA
jgi:hemoglobin-like flavoprotein